MGKSKPSTKRNTKGKAAKKQAPASKASSTASRFLLCPATGDKVFVGTATLQDLKNPPSSQKRKLLLKIPSSKTRATLYEELSLCLEDMETRLLPRYGGRPWNVVVRVQDNGSSPFFRWFRGKLEIAVLPHLLEKIPAPPRFPGYVQTEQGVKRITAHTADADDDVSVYDLTEEELQRMESLQGREISSLSQVAWDHRNDKNKGAPIPTISIKWTCPLRQIFTSRKAAHDHAVELAKGEQYIDRYLHGLGARGVLLKPFRPTRAQTLQAGKIRFLRDGLWAAGQEQKWQQARYKEMEKERQEAEAAARVEVKKQDATEQQKKEPQRTKRKRLTPMGLFIHVNRLAYKEKRLKELEKEAQNNKKEAKREPEPEQKQVVETTTVSKTAHKVGLPPPKKKPKNHQHTAKISFTVRDAENELREVWKKLPNKEKLSWEARSEASFYRKLELDEEAHIEAEESDGKDEESEADSEAEEEEEGGEGSNAENGEEQRSEGEEKQEQEGDDDTSEESIVELATEEERFVWELFSDAEQKIWGKSMTAPNKPKKKPQQHKDSGQAGLVGSSEEEKKEKDVKSTNGTSSHPTVIKDQSKDKKAARKPGAKKLSYEQCRVKVFENFMGITQKDYEKEMLKSLKPSTRRKVLQDKREQEKLKEQGMQQLLPGAHEIMKSRLERWVKDGINRAHNRNLKHEREEAAKKATAEQAKAQSPSVLAAATPSVPTSTKVVESKVDPPAPLAGVDNPASQGSTPATATANAYFHPANGLSLDEHRSAPISPSPTLAESTVTQSGPGAEATKKKTAQTETQHQSEIAPPSSPDKKRPRDDTNDKSAEVDEDSNQVSNTKSDKQAPQEPSFSFQNHFCMNEKQINKCKEAAMQHFEAVMRTVKAKDLTRELADGFDVLRERGRGRYDMELPAFDTEEFSFLTDIQKAPWMPIVRAVLGDDVVLIHKGCFLSLPGAENQNYHQDGTHLHPTSQRPCHAVNVFVPLVDMTRRHGPTEFCLGSHVLGQEDWDNRFIETPLPKKGVPVMFDYRLGHRGMGNSSREARPIVYCTYARSNEGKEFRDSINFSRRRYRKLGELVEKPLSREERNEKRRSKKDVAYYESLK